MRTTEILMELPKLSRVERWAILNRLIELDEDAEVLDECRRQVDEAFQMLDAMEAEEAESEAVTCGRSNGDSPPRCSRV